MNQSKEIKCKDCGGPGKWFYDVRTAKFVLADAEPVRHTGSGLVIVPEQGNHRGAPLGTVTRNATEGIEVYVPHWTVCKNGRKRE